MSTNKWVACWGYDQTQYSIYEEVSRKGSFVVVRGYNEWSCLGESDLCEGSKVKIYVPMRGFYDYLPEVRAEIATKQNWNAEQAQTYDGWEAFRRNYNREREEETPVRTIVKVSHEKVDGFRRWIWTMDNGEVVKQTHEFIVKILDAHTRRKITERCGEPSIKINGCIRAHLDENFGKNVRKYEEQNEYTAYNPR